MNATVRVATTQYRTGNDLLQNLDTLVDLVKQAAQGGENRLTILSAARTDSVIKRGGMISMKNESRV